MIAFPWLHKGEMRLRLRWRWQCFHRVRSHQIRTWIKVKLTAFCGDQFEFWFAGVGCEVWKWKILGPGAPGKIRKFSEIRSLAESGFWTFLGSNPRSRWLCVFIIQTSCHQKASDLHIGKPSFITFIYPLIWCEGSFSICDKRVIYDFLKHLSVSKHNKLQTWPKYSQ